MRAAAGKGLLKMGTLRASVATSAVTAALALAVSLPATAQDGSGSVSSYRLPDPTRTPAPQPKTAGPVDPEAPIRRPTATPTEETQPEDVAAPKPAATTPPRITPPPPQPRAPPTADQRTARPATPAPTATATPAARQKTESAPTATTAPAPVASEAVIADAPAEILGSEALDSSLTPESTEPSSDATVTPDDTSNSTSTPAENDWVVPSLVGAGILAAGVFAFSRRRRKGTTSDEPETETYSPSLTPAPVTKPVAPKPAPQQPPAVPAPAPTPAPEPVQTPAPPLVSTEPPNALAITTTFTPKAVRLSLVFATVQYELEVANEGTLDVSELRVLADLGSAHASLSTQEQLAPLPEHMEANHGVPALTAGTTTLLKGEVRVPLQVMPTLAKGEARFFVPLVRFVLLDSHGMATRRVFTLGPLAADGTTITPVRLDAGPRNLRELASREIEAARGFGIDPTTTQP